MHRNGTFNYADFSNACSAFKLNDYDAYPQSSHTDLNVLYSSNFGSISRKRFYPKYFFSPLFDTYDNSGTNTTVYISCGILIYSYDSNKLSNAHSNDFDD